VLGAAPLVCDGCGRVWRPGDTFVVFARKDGSQGALCEATDAPSVECREMADILGDEDLMRQLTQPCDGPWIPWEEVKDNFARRCAEEPEAARNGTPEDELNEVIYRRFDYGGPRVSHEEMMGLLRGKRHQAALARKLARLAGLPTADEADP
jgi:hypothetical protein